MNTTGHWFTSEKPSLLISDPFPCFT